MDSSRPQKVEKNRRSQRRSSLALRYRREATRPVGGAVYPFTEVPKELKRAPFSPGKLFRNILSGALLLLLVIALTGLVLAFAYQLIHQPQVLADWGNGLVGAGQEFLSAIISAFQ